jgi:cytoskeletal protein CcmA (bactofilin family)
MLKADDHKKEIQAPVERSTPSRVSHLGPSLKINGEITGTDNIVVEGVFEGRIRLEGHDVLVESGGRVKADLVVRNVTIRGVLEGNIQASGIVLIEANGRMSGDIAAARISVMEGAQFKGGVKITRT